MSIAFTFATIGVGSNIISFISFGLNTGGPVIIIWGWIACSILTFLCGIFLYSGLSLAEICSAYPFAGSVYFWTGKVAKESYSPILSYICGSFILMGALTNVTTNSLAGS